VESGRETSAFRRGLRSDRPRACSTMPPLRTRVPLIVSVLLALAVPAPAQAAKEVAYPALLRQIKSRPLLRAVINRAGGDIEIKFRDLSEWKAFYPRSAQPMLQRLLHERHVRVIFASRKSARAKASSVHHHLRYIAAGILGALALAGCAFYFLRRRRTRGHPREDAAIS
jgi:hypothetical protein